MMQSKPENLRLTVKNGFLHVVDIKDEVRKLSRSGSDPTLNSTANVNEGEADWETASGSSSEDKAALSEALSKVNVNEGEADWETACGSSSGDIAALTEATSSEGSSESKEELSCRTVMIKNLPCCCNQDEILSVIGTFGFGDLWDFFYMPTRKPKRSKNLGYAFISFPDVSQTKQFGEAMTGYRFPKCNDKSIAVVPARLQESYKELFKSSRAKKRVVISRPSLAL